MKAKEVTSTQYYHPLKSNSKAINQMPVRKFVDSLNLKIPAVKIYSFSDENPRKTKQLYPKCDNNLNFPTKSAKLQIKNDITIANTTSMATTESSYNKPQSSGLPEIRTRAPGKSLVMSSYKGFQEKIKPELKKKGNLSKTEIKPLFPIEKKIKETNEKKYIGIEMLKGAMYEGNAGIEGFSESTIRIEPDFEIWESQRDILDFLVNNESYK